MNPMEQDLRSLGLRLWPDDTRLRPTMDGRRTPARLRSGLGALAFGLITFAVLFGVIALSLAITHGRSKAPAATASAPADNVIRVDITVPRNPLAVEVARGATLALHLHRVGGTGQSAWAVGLPGSNMDAFQPVQVPYPGVHPASSATDFYVAFRIPSDGTTQLSIEIPVTCADGESCPVPPPLLITVRGVAPPIRTATVTGELITTCASPSSSTLSCAGAGSGATIRFRSSSHAMVTTMTDAQGDYVVELAPGTWHISTTLPSLPVQTSTLTVAAGGIRVDDLRVNALASDSGAVVGGIYRCFGLPESISGPPTRVAGIVDVFAGNRIATSQPKFAEESVAAGGTYTFDLPPGTYVLIGHWTGSNLSPPMATVTVTSGTVTSRNLDYVGCA
jgi:hypothetical protein